jgi:hypothetical protein
MRRINEGETINQKNQNEGRNNQSEGLNEGETIDQKNQNMRNNQTNNESIERTNQRKKSQHMENQIKGSNQRPKSGIKPTTG